MPFHFTDFETAKNRPGLRLVAIKGIPSPWTEAAKAVLHIKKQDFVAVYHDPFNTEMTAWTQVQNAPVLKYNDEAPVSDWQDILMLAELLAPSPSLLPQDASERSQALELSHLLCARDGLGWYRRLDSIHKGLTGEAGGFPEKVARYLASRYGYEEGEAMSYIPKTADILQQLSTQLQQQKQRGERFYLGSSLSAVDVYSAAFMALFKPLPEDQCSMKPYARPVFETLDPQTSNALDPILLKHRDFIYNSYLELPLQL